MDDFDDLSVLHLVTAEEIFFKQQIEILEEKSVNCTVSVVPGGQQLDGGMADKRSIIEYIRYYPRVRRELRRGDYDLIHANYGLTAPYAVTQNLLPVVLTLWGSDVVGFDGLVTKAFSWRADAVMVRTNEMREILGRDDAYIVPSGIDLDRFRPIDRSEARKHVGWDVDGTYVLFPYSQEYDRKNFPLAEHVVKLVETTLDTKISLQTISGVDHHEVVYYINASDALILTSDHEGSPNTVKEAMACNVPVVSTDVGDVKERLQNVSPGGVGTTEEQLVNLLTHVLRRGARSNGRKQVQSLSWDNIANRILDIYREVL